MWVPNMTINQTLTTADIIKPRFSRLSQRLDTKSDNAWRVHDRALAMKKQGEDVILLSIGDPDFRTPDPIIDNAVSHMRVGRTHYSPILGELSFRRAVADQETRTSPHPCSIDEVAIFPGATSALYSVMSCLLNAGDEVVIPEPLYVGYEPIMNAINAEIRSVPTAPEKQFVPQFEDIVAAVTANTRAILINTPGNPTGAIIGKETLRRLARFCHDNNLWLVCDEVYSMFTYEKPHTSLRAAAERLDNIVMIDGLSKSHAMSGWRMGWVVAPADLIRQLENFANMSIFGCPQFIQDAAAFALSNDEYYVQEMRLEYRKRRDLVCRQLDAIPKFKYLRPESGMFVMVDISGINTDDLQFARDLLAAEMVSVLPGSVFGGSTRGHVRLSLAQSAPVLAEGCQRIARFIKDNNQS